MFYIKKDKKIVLFDENKEKLQNTLVFMPQYADLKIQTTDKEIIEYNSEFVFKESVAEELLKDAKQAKYNEANEGAKAYLENGAVYEFTRQADSHSELDSESPNPATLSQAQGDTETYHIEATDGNIAKLSAYALSYLSGVLSSTDTVSWNTKEDVTIELTQQELSQVLAGIGEVQAQVWTVKFPAYVAQIEAATTVEEVEAIEVDYSKEIKTDEKDTASDTEVAENDV